MSDTGAIAFEAPDPPAGLQEQTDSPSVTETAETTGIEDEAKAEEEES